MLLFIFEKVIKCVIFAFLYQWISIFAHEMGHYFIAKIFSIKVQSISIGLGYSLFVWHKLNVSLNISGGYVDIDTDDLFMRGKFAVILFFTSGCIINLLMCGISFLILEESCFKLVVLCITCVMIFCNMLPVGQTDMKEMIETLKGMKEF